MKHRTRIDIPAARRDKLVALLQARLYDGLDLIMQAKTAHWNVRGPQFIALHELFDEVAEGAEEAVDELAERIGQLGSSADGTVAGVARGTGLEAYPLNIADGDAHVAALAGALAQHGAALRAAIDQAGRLGDQATADLFTELTRSADLLLWKVEAHQQGR